MKNLNISLIILEVIPKPTRNAVYGTDNAKNKGFRIGSN